MPENTETEATSKKEIIEAAYEWFDKVSIEPHADHIKEPSVRYVLEDNISLIQSICGDDRKTLDRTAQQTISSMMKKAYRKLRLKTLNKNKSHVYKDEKGNTYCPLCLMPTPLYADEAARPHYCPYCGTAMNFLNEKQLTDNLKEIQDLMKSFNRVCDRHKHWIDSEHPEAMLALHPVIKLWMCCKASGTCEPYESAENALAHIMTTSGPYVINTYLPDPLEDIAK